MMNWMQERDAAKPKRKTTPAAKRTKILAGMPGYRAHVAFLAWAGEHLTGPELARFSRAWDNPADPAGQLFVGRLVRKIPAELREVCTFFTGDAT
jgi:hypothetical protein